MRNQPAGETLRATALASFHAVVFVLVPIWLSRSETIKGALKGIGTAYGLAAFTGLWLILAWCGKRYLREYRENRGSRKLGQGSLSLAISNGGIAGLLFFWVILILVGVNLTSEALGEGNSKDILEGIVTAATFALPIGGFGSVAALLVGGVVGAVAITVDAFALKIARLILATCGLAMDTDEVPF